MRAKFPGRVPARPSLTCRMRAPRWGTHAVSLSRAGRIGGATCAATLIRRATTARGALGRRGLGIRRGGRVGCRSISGSASTFGLFGGRTRCPAGCAGRARGFGLFRLHGCLGASSVCAIRICTW
jgi:hypothetical protein